jgi:hypothetical protein
VSIGHFDEPFFTLSDFLFNDFIGAVVIEIEFFLNFVHLNERKNYEMLDIKAVMIEDISDVFDFRLNIVTRAIDEFHFFLSLSFVAEL